MAQHISPLDDLFLALSDPTRRAVIARLGQGPASVSTLAAPFNMALPSFMKHIRILEESRLIRTEKQGRIRTCRANPTTLALAGRWIDEQRAIWEARTDRLERLVTQTPRKDQQ